MMANIPKLRLYIRDNIDSDKIIYLNEKQSHYLVNVRRSNIGDFIALFNGRDGEWIAEIKSIEKKIVSLNIIKCLRIQEKQTNIWLAFAPIKRGRIDLIAEKATELGVSRLIPVITARTQTTRVNTARLRANAHEAAQQCERLTVPEIIEPISLKNFLSSWPLERRMLVADETGGGAPILDVVSRLGNKKNTACALLVGPEGGFSVEELDVLSKLPFVTKIDLGPRILRAETAVVAAISVIQAVAGDWQSDKNSNG